MYPIKLLLLSTVTAQKANAILQIFIAFTTDLSCANIAINNYCALLLYGTLKFELDLNIFEARCTARRAKEYLKQILILFSK